MNPLPCPEKCRSVTWFIFHSYHTFYIVNLIYYFLWGFFTSSSFIKFIPTFQAYCNKHEWCTHGMWYSIIPYYVLTVSQCMPILALILCIAFRHVGLHTMSMIAPFIVPLCSGKIQVNNIRNLRGKIEIITYLQCSPLPCQAMLLFHHLSFDSYEFICLSLHWWSIPANVQDPLQVFGVKV